MTRTQNCGEMKSRVVFFVAAIVLLKLVSTEAYQCYNCRYVSTLSSPWQNASCTEPFNSTDVQTCEGKFCIAIWANFTDPAGSYVLQRTCTNDSNAVTVDQCEKLSDSSRKFFLYQNSCCLLTPNTTLPNDNRRFDQMSCGCQTDNCNGNVSYPVMPMTTPATTETSNLTTVTTTNSNPNTAPGSLSALSVMLFCTAIALVVLEN